MQLILVGLRLMDILNGLNRIMIKVHYIYDVIWFY